MSVRNESLQKRRYAMKLAAVSFVIFVMVAMRAPDAPGQTAGKWTKLAPFPEPAEEVYGAAAGGKMYVMGGLAPGWKPRGLVFEYDPASDKWTKKKPMPLSSHHLAIVELGGKIYVIGGGGTSPGSKEPSIHPTKPHLALGTVEEYDPATNSWRARTPMPTPRNHSGIGVVGGKIYVIGGRTGAAFIGVGANSDIVEEYDPVTDAWGPIKARMPTPRSAVAYATYKDRI